MKKVEKNQLFFSNSSAFFRQVHLTNPSQFLQFFLRRALLTNAPKEQLLLLTLYPNQFKMQHFFILIFWCCSLLVICTSCCISSAQLPVVSVRCWVSVRGRYHAFPFDLCCQDSLWACTMQFSKCNERSFLSPHYWKPKKFKIMSKKIKFFQKIFLKPNFMDFYRRKQKKRTLLALSRILVSVIILFCPVFQLQLRNSLKLPQVVCHQHQIFRLRMCGNQHIHRADRSSLSLQIRTNLPVFHGC